MISIDGECRRSKERLFELEAQLRGLSSVRRSAVIDALRMQAEDLEREISEYEGLKE